MRGGSERLQILQPRTTVVQTAKAAGAFTGAHLGDDPESLNFWGRGVATTWRVTIEAEEMSRRQVDLSGLSSIDLEIGYTAFL